MKLLIILAFVAALAAVHPQKTIKKEMAVASESASQAQAFSESKSFSKSEGSMKESSMDMGDMNNMFGMSGMGWMAKPPRVPAPRAAPDGAAAAGDSVGKSMSKSKEALAATDASNDESPECKKNCIDEGELGPVDAPSAIKILMNPEGAYAVFSTYKNYNKVTELLRGKPLESRDELSKLCILGTCNKDQHKIQGFGKTFVSDCTASKTGLTATCTLNAAASDNKDVKKYPNQLSVVWTDSKAYVLMASCWTDGQKLWVTLSNEKTAIPEDVKKTVLDKINELGLDIQDPVGLSYDSCEASN